MRRRAQAEAQAAAERLRVDEERRREEEARAAEVRRRAQEEEGRRNRWVTGGLLRAGVIEQVGDGCSSGGSRTRGDGCCVQGVVHDWCAATVMCDGCGPHVWLIDGGYVDNRRILDGCGPHVWLVDGGGVEEVIG